MVNRQAQTFLLWEQASRDTVDFKKCYVDLADDLVAGLLLSQIVYWHLPSKETGKTKLRVKHAGHLWIAKAREDWWDEIRITPKQFDRAIKILVKKGLVEKGTFKFNGNPTIHTRLIWDNFLPALDSIIYKDEEDENEYEPLEDMVIPQRAITNLPKGEKGNSSKGNNDIDLSVNSLTKNTTKTKTKINKEDIEITRDEISSDITSFEFKSLIINESNEFYSKIAPGRYNKKQWNTLIEKFANDTVSRYKPSDLLNKNLKGFIYISLTKMADHSDYKKSDEKAEYDEIQLKLAQSPVNENLIERLSENVPFYNWLE